MTEYVKIQAGQLLELLSDLEFSEDHSASLFSQDDHPVAAVSKLFNAKHFIDGIKILAHSLPKREAVWWACIAVKHTFAGESVENAAALSAAEAWARHPTEPNRLQCKKLAELLQHKTPAAWAATSAAWCTGSIAEEGQPQVAPPEKLYAHAVAGAVSLAAVAGNPAQSEQHYQHFLRQGLNLAAGGNGQI